MMRFALPSIVIGLVLLLAGCSIVERFFPSGTEPGQVELPKLPIDLQDVMDLQDIVETFGGLELPDLSDLPNVPQLDTLPLLESIPGGMVLRGPVQRTIKAGDHVPGTDIALVSTAESDAEFEIAGLRSVRKVGDSLDFDGAWPGLPGVSYSARLRIYHIGNNRVRIAGVQQLGIPDVRPEVGKYEVLGTKLTFPIAANVGMGSTIPGTTYGYGGENDRGAEMTGVAADEYPYRKTGDSIVWRGRLRQDIPVEYNFRTIHYDGNALQVAGVISVTLPEARGSAPGGD